MIGPLEKLKIYLAWFFLFRETNKWKKAGCRPNLWWRDDDTIDVTPNLERLVSLAQKFNAPILLAVIPGDGASDNLVRLNDFLEKQENVFVGQHGVNHVNRRKQNTDPQAEFCDWADSNEIEEEIRSAWPRIEALHGSLRIFVPPWNVAPQSLKKALNNLQLKLSSSEKTIGNDGLNIHLDLLKWKPAAHFCGESRTLFRLRRALVIRRVSGNWNQPVGILTHHLVHDEATWNFLEKFLAKLATDHVVLWATPSQLLVAMERNT